MLPILRPLGVEGTSDNLLSIQLCLDPECAPTVIPPQGRDASSKIRHLKIRATACSVFTKLSGRVTVYRGLIHSVAHFYLLLDAFKSQVSLISSGLGPGGGCSQEVPLTDSALRRLDPITNRKDFQRLSIVNVDEFLDPINGDGTFGSLGVLLRGLRVYGAA